MAAVSVMAQNPAGVTPEQLWDAGMTISYNISDNLLCQNQTQANDTAAMLQTVPVQMTGNGKRNCQKFTDKPFTGSFSPIVTTDNANISSSYCLIIFFSDDQCKTYAPVPYSGVVGNGGCMPNITFTDPPIWVLAQCDTVPIGSYNMNHPPDPIDPTWPPYRAPAINSTV